MKAIITEAKPCREGLQLSLRFYRSRDGYVYVHGTWPKPELPPDVSLRADVDVVVSAQFMNSITIKSIRPWRKKVTANKERVECPFCKEDVYNLKAHQKSGSCRAAQVRAQMREEGLVEPSFSLPCTALIQADVPVTVERRLVSYRKRGWGKAHKRESYVVPDWVDVIWDLIPNDRHYQRETNDQFVALIKACAGQTDFPRHLLTLKECLSDDALIEYVIGEFPQHASLFGRQQ